MIMASLAHKLAEGFVKPSPLFFCVGGGGGGGLKILLTDLFPNTYAQLFLDNERILRRYLRAVSINDVIIPTTEHRFCDQTFDLVNRND